MGVMHLATRSPAAILADKYFPPTVEPCDADLEELFADRVVSDFEGHLKTLSRRAVKQLLDMILYRYGYVLHTRRSHNEREVLQRYIASRGTT
jgi:hypothetical protein